MIYQEISDEKKESNVTVEKELWDDYCANKSIDSRNKLIEHYLYILYKPVKSIYQMCRSTNELSDIFQSAVIGLIEAIEYYSPDRNASFKTYSNTRIYGSVIDYLRKTGLMKIPYKVRRKIREERKKHEDDNNSADFVNPYSIVSINAMSDDDDNDFTYLDVLTDDDLTEDIVLDSIEKEELYEALKKIPTDEYITLVHYYFMENTLEDIAESLNMSKAGVWQIKNRALNHLRFYMHNSNL